ncbi:WD40 repeat-like protein [Malassezia vespertilionis]|uniref:WD40 repeat-like protein n=1 Tax=Malassezia vespertilionis TaxID=2020962 RepID=UPI0024B12AF4|nr:WD40 repeat-like protein [Malassezia vespertilionis]WFD07294.1 WD40 repeat-like protein [Malassezia vespertilionis]
MSLTRTGTYASNPVTVRGTCTKLSASSRGDKVAYGHGRTVVVRDLNAPSNTLVYAEHTHHVTVARFSPSGFYMASGDTSGSVRVWSLDGEERILKLHVQAMSGRITDLVWDGESKRIIAVGEGREKFGHAFLVDSGSSVGEISGHSKVINAAAIRAQRPFKAVTGGDDASVIFYTGVPFKYAKTLRVHTRFVQDVAYMPDGSVFVSAGSDGRVFAYDGQSGDVLGEFKDGESAHAGTVYAVSFAPAPAPHLVSVGADGHVKVWDVHTRGKVAAYEAGQEAGDKLGAQQVGAVWAQRETILSVDVAGRMHRLTFSGSALHLCDMLVGPTQGVTSLVRSAASTLASSYDGRVYVYADDGRASMIPAPLPASPSIVAMGAEQSCTVLAALDDAARVLKDGAYTYVPLQTYHSNLTAALQGQPKAMASAQATSYVLTDKGVDIVRDGRVTHCSSAALGMPSAPTAVSVSRDGASVAIGAEDTKVYLFSTHENGLDAAGTLENGRSAITALAFSPDAALLAAGESTGKIFVYDVAARQVKLTQWVFHTARINALAWSENGAYCARTRMSMSLPDLVGGAQCGPVNPLQQLGKRFGQDRATPFDAQRSSPAPQAAFRSRPMAQADDAAFFARANDAVDPGAHFHVDQMRQALPTVRPQGADWRDMETSFLQHPASMAGSSRHAAAQATPAWAHDFMKHTAPMPSAVKMESAPRSAPYAMRMPAFQRQFRPPMHAAPQPMSVQRDTLDTLSNTVWDSAFTAVDAQHGLHESVANALPAAEALHNMDADALAQTAERLLASVQHDTSDKFKQSQFMELMRKLRDRQAEVHGAEIVGHGTHKGEGRAARGPPTQEELDQMREEASRSMHRSTNNVTPPAQILQLDTAQELSEYFAQEDAARRSEAERNAAHDPRNVFQGDGGDVLERMREDEQYVRPPPAEENIFAAEMNKWTGMGANVARAGPGWEEDLSERGGAQEQDDEDFVGRAWEGAKGKGRVGAQEAEWARLQSDWDEFEASEPSIRPTAQAPFPFEAPAYSFNENNPYAASRTHHHAMHATQMDAVAESVLEHEAEVQNDPSKSSAWYNLGLRQQENEREKQAIAALHKAVALDPRMNDAWLALAISYTNENEREAALESLERWIEVNDTYADVVQKYTPRETGTHGRVAGILMAMARAGMPGSTEVDADIQVALGVLFNSSSEYDKAVDCFATALGVRPEDWLLYNRIGATLSNSGRSEESLDYYYQALALRPGFARCHFNLSISCLNLKRYQEAAEHALTALTLQHASEEELSGGERGQNTSVWEILRVSLELMQRPDLARLASARDLNAIQLHDLLG